jgi:hypothetical protein
MARRHEIKGPDEAVARRNVRESIEDKRQNGPKPRAFRCEVVCRQPTKVSEPYEQ